MLQSIGVVLLALGSIALSLSVLRNYLTQFNQLEWKNFPWEARQFAKLFKIKNKQDFYNRLFISNRALSSDEKFDCRKRFILDLPLIAIILMIIGMFFCLDYASIINFINSLVGTT